MPMVRLIRHAASRSNEPGLHADPDWAALTAQGHAQAARWAAQADVPPTLLVLSPALRATLTAAPLMVRHPGLLAEVWPVGEFTYLARAQTAFTGPDGRRPWVLAYWQRADSAHVDGEGAESYEALFERAWSARVRLEAWWKAAGDGAQLWMVSHAQFLWALTWCLSQEVRAGMPPMAALRAETERPAWPTLGWQDWAWPACGRAWGRHGAGTLPEVQA